MESRAKTNQLEFKKIPIFKATKSLDVKYIFNYNDDTISTIVPAAHTHAVLYAGYNGLIDERSEMLSKKKKPIYKNSIDHINFCTAAITVLWADTSLEEGYLGEDINQTTFYLSVQKKADSILSPLDFYTEQNNIQKGVASSKARRDTSYNKFLKQRTEAFSDISNAYDLPHNMICTTAKLDESIKGPMFHETFHHTEQGAFHYLSTPVGINNLVKNIGKTKAVHLYGMVGDLFTQRMMCVNCNCSALGIQCTHEAGFLNDFIKQAEKARIEPRDNLMFNIRVSAKQPARQSATLDSLRLPQDYGQVHEYKPDEQHPRVFQAENKALGTRKLITDNDLTLASYPGTFFVSSSFSKAKLEEQVKQLRSSTKVS